MSNIPYKVSELMVKTGTAYHKTQKFLELVPRVISSELKCKAGILYFDGKEEVFGSEPPQDIMDHVAKERREKTRNVVEHDSWHIFPIYSPDIDPDREDDEVLRGAIYVKLGECPDEVKKDIITAANCISIVGTYDKTIISQINEKMEMISAKDNYTGDHCSRVNLHSYMLGKKIGLSEEELEDISFEGEIHDIGKVYTPDAILQKPAKLTKKEWKIIKRHPEEGYRLVKKLYGFHIRGINIIRYHHERFDGDGYPSGLKGEKIPLLARVACVADVFDALTTDRPYRKKMNLEDALDLMGKSSGKQFDPEILNGFVALANDEREGIVRIMES